MKVLSEFHVKDTRMMKKFQCIIDDSMSIMMISLGLTILGGILAMMLFQSCVPASKKNATNPEVKSIASELIMLLADHPESVEIIAFSELDSIYGNNFFNEMELNSIFDSSFSLAKASLDNNVDFSKPEADPKFMALMKRGIGISDIYMQCLNQDQNCDAPFSGYKIKVLYKCKNDFDETEKNEKYIIFDKSKQHILHSFDIPIL